MAVLLVFTCNQNRQFPPMCTRAGRVEFARGPLRARAAAPARPAQPRVIAASGKRGERRAAASRPAGTHGQSASQLRICSALAADTNSGVLLP